MSPLHFLKDLWSDAEARALETDALELLRYRSNLLGADLRITNFGGGNTSSKIELEDPFTRRPAAVLAVKGSGGDLGSIRKSGFALLYMERLEQLRAIYRGEAFEDEMVDYYALSSFGRNQVPASIDTPLHAFLPFPHVDHLHPDWAIALAASANGDRKMAEFNQRFGRKLVWLPWQRPGFELALQLRRAVEAAPDCDGILLGGHGLFTWGNTQRECYWNSLLTIDQMGQFVTEHERRRGVAFGGPEVQTRSERRSIAARVLPTLRGLVSSGRHCIGHFKDDPDVMEFVNSRQAQELADLGTSCPDHFLRTRIKPLFVEWNPGSEDIDELKASIREGIERYRFSYTAYYRSFAEPASPAMRSANPAVVLVPGVGMFSFGKDAAEARIAGEFFINAIHVMRGASALGEDQAPAVFPQAKDAADSKGFRSRYNYVALPPREAFRIEYWALEEAKLQRMPPEQEFSRRVFLLVGAGSGIGRSTVLELLCRGAHVMAADIDAGAAAATAASWPNREQVASCPLNLTDRASIRAAIEETLLRFGGLDGVVNTAAIFPVAGGGNGLSVEQWGAIMQVNITGNYLLADEANLVFQEQGLPAVLVLTSSANAVVPKRGSEAYDVSKSALNQLIRELAIGMAPLVRVNGIAPATVVAGSAMFPRDRTIQSLRKYGIAFGEDEPTEALRAKLAAFYAGRTLTRRPITTEDCARAICWLAGSGSDKTSGHIIPVDGGLPEAFLR